MQKLYTFFKSVKLALVLIAFIGVISILATLIPQNRQPDFYYQNLPSFVSRLILGTQMDRAFRSLIFNLAVIMFFLNLTVCTVDRLTREFRGKRKRRFGPDLIHIGILVLVIGGLVTFRMRKEGSAYIAVGDEIGLPGGYTVVLESYEFIAYEDGRPKDWISTVDVYKGGVLVIDSFPIEVNRPARIGNIKLYQASYAADYIAVLESADGLEIRTEHGREIPVGDTVYVFLSVEEDVEGKPLAFFSQGAAGDGQKIVSFPDGAVLGDFTVSMVRRDLTGLQAVIDPGFIPVLIGLALCGAGMILTYAQKIGDREI